jgi:hypothetical protein
VEIFSEILLGLLQIAFEFLLQLVFEALVEVGVRGIAQCPGES